jgi:membrane protease YdiL (CAAX protease family)
MTFQDDAAKAQEPAPESVPSTSAEPGPPLVPAPPAYPEDLQITWSWPHFTVFLVFCLVSFIVVNGIVFSIYAPHQKMSKEQLEQYFLSKPQVAIGSMVLLYAFIFFFLFVTLSILRGQSFWSSLGWRKLKARTNGMPRNPMIYFFSGCGLSLFVAILTSRMKTPENLPVEELFKYKQTAMFFMLMAVLVAPLVEETLFRGYLYPLFARSFGVGPGIVVTGVLFGLMHGAQLGWTVGLVSMLIFVGIIFTVVRARTGSVFASYMMHLGYNSLISLFAILATHGFSKLPQGQ